MSMAKSGERRGEAHANGAECRKIVLMMIEQAVFVIDHHQPPKVPNLPYQNTVW